MTRFYAKDIDYIVFNMKVISYHGNSTKRDVLCTIYSIHYTLCSVYCIVYSVYCIVYSIRYTVYIVHWYTLKCTMYIVHVHEPTFIFD